jgi:hypothetical protein
MAFADFGKVMGQRGAAAGFAVLIRRIWIEACRGRVRALPIR